MTAVKEMETGFNPAQYEIINMMSCLHGDSDYAELKAVLVKFLDARLQNAIDALYQDGQLSGERMEDLSHRHLRTPYEARV